MALIFINICNTIGSCPNSACAAKRHSIADDGEDQKTQFSPPTGVIGRSVQYERSTVGFNDEDESVS